MKVPSSSTLATSEMVGWLIGVSWRKGAAKAKMHREDTSEILSAIWSELTISVLSSSWMWCVILKLSWLIWAMIGGCENTSLNSVYSLLQVWTLSLGLATITANKLCQCMFHCDPNVRHPLEENMSGTVDWQSARYGNVWIYETLKQMQCRKFLHILSWKLNAFTETWKCNVVLCHFYKWLHKLKMNILMAQQNCGVAGMLFRGGAWTEKLI